MSELTRLILKSFLIGFTAAASLGPIALICIQRTLKSGWRVGVASGLGVALADGTFGLIGALGLSALTQLFLQYQRLLGLVGGAILIFLGLRALITTVENIPPIQRPAERDIRDLWRAGASIFFLTLSNPVTIMFFSAVYAGLMIDETGLVASGFAVTVLFSAGIFAGSFIWWVILVSFISAVRQRFKLHQLLWLNRISGLAITGFGAWVLVNILLRV